MTRIAPQIATKIPATNSQTLPLRTNAAHASAASAARARRSISLKYSMKKFIKTLPVRGRHMARLLPIIVGAVFHDDIVDCGAHDTRVIRRQEDDCWGN